jgi:hypothetical protein
MISVGTNRRILFGGLLAAVVLMAAAPALGQDSSVRGYGGTGGNVQGDLGPAAVGPESGGGGPGAVGPGTVGPTEGSGGPTGEVDSGSLPFTGLDLALLVGGGAVLLSAGAGIALANRRRETGTDLA